MNHLFRIFALGTALSTLAPLPASARAQDRDIDRNETPVETAPSTPSAPEPGTSAPSNLSPRAGALLDNFKNAMERGFNNLRKRDSPFWGHNSQIVGSQTRVFFFDQLPMNSAQAFHLSFNGGKEGHYILHGTLTKTSQTERETKITLKLASLECVKESEWDGLTDSDEPMLFWTLNSLMSQPDGWYSYPFEDVDTGESKSFTRHTWDLVLPTDARALAWNVAVVEWDGSDTKLFAGGLWAFNDEFKRQWASAAPDLLNELRNTPAAPVPTPTPTRPAPTPTPTRPAPTPTPVPTTPTTPQPEFPLSDWVGFWDTTFGKLTISRANDVLYGQVTVTDAVTGLERKREKIELRASRDLFKDLYTVEGKIMGPYPGTLFFRMSDSKNSFTGAYRYDDWTPDSPRQPWNGTRLNGLGQPMPTAPTAPSAPTPPQPTPSVPTTPVPGGGEFYPMSQNLHVRLDKLEAARDGKTHIFVTLRNAGTQQQHIVDGRVQSLLTDEDGVTQHFATLYRASGTTLERFASSPVLEASAEIPVRLVVTPIPGGGPLKQLVLRDGTSQPANFDLSGLSVPGRVATPPTVQANHAGQWHEFKSLDVRFDGAKAARGNEGTEVFLTFRNPSNSPQWIVDGSYKVAVTNAGGAKTYDDGKTYPVRGLRGLALPSTPVVPPSGETRLRFFIRNASGSAFTLENGGTKFEVR